MKNVLEKKSCEKSPRSPKDAMDQELWERGRDEGWGGMRAGACRGRMAGRGSGRKNIEKALPWCLDLKRVADWPVIH